MSHFQERRKILKKIFFRIIIFIRGAPSSGKSFLAHKIMEQEKLFGTKRMKFCTPNKYYANQSFNRDEADKYVKNLHSEVQDLLMEGFYTFIIVEMEGFKLDILNKLGDLATASLFEVYGIDVNQTVEVCKQYQKHSRYNSDIEEIAKEVEKNSMPYNFKLLNPVELIDPGWNARNPPKPPKTPSPPSKSRKNRGGFGRRRKSSSDSYDSDACFVCYG